MAKRPFHTTSSTQPQSEPPDAEPSLSYVQAIVWLSSSVMVSVCRTHPCSPERDAFTLSSTETESLS